MDLNSINEDFLLLLVDADSRPDLRKIPISKNFERERLNLFNLCSGNEDNFDAIIQFIDISLKQKLPAKNFNYCQVLDKAYQSVKINIAQAVQDIQLRKNLIYYNQKLAKQKEETYNIAEKISELKKEINSRILLWFKAFDIELAYESAKKIKSLLVYSHRLSGWSNPEYKITSTLKQQIQTNFGFGSVSYFYTVLTYKDIQITPLSEWIDYHKANFSQIIRYTRNYRTRILVESSYGDYYKTKIENSSWYYAMLFTKEAANLLIDDEDGFIKKYIILECERMVSGLKYIYEDSFFEFKEEGDEKTIVRRDIKGYELIDFRTEKIIGALDFIGKIQEYSKIIDVGIYLDQIFEINKKFLPTLLKAIDDLNNQLAKGKLELAPLLEKEIEAINRKKFYDLKKFERKEDFAKTYPEYEAFINSFNDIIQTLNKKRKHILDIEKNILKMNSFKAKFDSFNL